MSFWTVEIALSAAGFGLAAYLFVMYYGFGVHRSSIGRKVVAAVGFMVVQMALLLVLSLNLASFLPKEAAVPSGVGGPATVTASNGTLAIPLNESSSRGAAFVAYNTAPHTYTMYPVTMVQNISAQVAVVMIVVTAVEVIALALIVLAARE